LTRPRIYEKTCAKLEAETKQMSAIAAGTNDRTWVDATLRKLGCAMPGLIRTIKPSREERTHDHHREEDMKTILPPPGRRQPPAPRWPTGRPTARSK
jgi:hypothetical protein